MEKKVNDKHPPNVHVDRVLVVTVILSAFLHVTLVALWKTPLWEVEKKGPAYMIARLYRPVQQGNSGVNSLQKQDVARPEPPMAPVENMAAPLLPEPPPEAERPVEKAIPDGGDTLDISMEPPQGGMKPSLPVDAKGEEEGALLPDVGRIEVEPVVEKALDEGREIPEQLRFEANFDLPDGAPFHSGPQLSYLAGRPEVEEEKPEADVDALLADIRRRIESQKTYPLMARKRGWEGSVVVELELGGGGEVEAVRLLEESGYDVLDRATLAAVRKAEPFPPLAGKVQMPLSYTLKK